MLDIKLFRENPELIFDSEKKRFRSTENVEKVIEYDTLWREGERRLNSLRAEKNKLSKSFKKAKVVIDPFHIVTQCYVALNSTRISLCKKNNIHYNKLKDLWKLIIKNENDLSNKKVYSKHFHKEISQIDMVNYMINTNQTLRADYNCYQGIINSLKEKNFIKFKNIIEHPSKDLSIKMKNALKLYRENIKYIENTFNYNINNGIIEGTNNIIKTIKRIAFGYKRFDHFVSRIFLIKGIIKG